MGKEMTEKEMQKEAVRFIRRIIKEHSEAKGALVVGLVGELGAGKTTFVKAVARELGIAESVTSPTFVIEKIYQINRNPFLFFIHIDAYRLAEGDDPKHLGWNEIKKDSHNIVCIEWADRVKESLPAHVLWVNLQMVSETRRRIHYHYGTKKRNKT